MTIPSGSMIADRFEIGRLLGAGGMGTVYCARDRHDGDLVALKLLHNSMATGPEADRFEREARLLAELSHPGIVKYVAHGQTQEGQRYLAMEWLDGEDLGERLRRGPLSIADSVALLVHVAASLGVVHKLGTIHRDLKPSNLFLPGGQIDRVKLLDFGIARRAVRSIAVTHTGLVIGTPEYMAPEQARSERELSPAADIFSLGCILYECLAGRPPFVAEHIAAVLVRILFEDPPPVRDHRPNVPDSLISILDRMLAKDPGKRISDTDSLARELSALALSGSNEDPPRQHKSEPAAAPLSNRELLLVSVIVLENLPSSLEEHQQDAQARDTFQRIAQTGARFGARVDHLAEGTVLMTFTQADIATDLAAQAAHCALALAAQLPTVRIAMATGRGLGANQLAMGEAFDRAISVLRTLPAAIPAPPSTPGSAMDRQPESAVRIWLNEASVGLLDGRFNIERVEGRPVLRNERSVVDESRQLLGKPTPCVGRDIELMTLDGIFTNCVDGMRSSGILITAAPGLGKSRLRHEFLRRMASRKEHVTVLLGFGTPLTAGSPYSSLRQALRRGLKIQDSETSSTQRAQLLAQVSAVLPPAAARRVVPFIGELCDVRFTEEEYPALRPARQDPKLMNAQVTMAFTEWLAAACAARPHLLVLEDLHWGDALTVKLVDAALQACAEVPFMAMALARPEIRDQHPALWRRHGITEIVLQPLSKRASERLAQQVLRQVLGRDVDQLTVSRIVEQAAGNALFLEELVRAVAEGNGDRLPESVLAMLQSRIGRLPTDDRKVLRAASVFGELFWRGGVQMVTGTYEDASEIDSTLQRLVDAGIIQPSTSSRFPTEHEYHFRHALTRDAAYSLLTEHDRMAAHRLAGLFFQRLSALRATEGVDQRLGTQPPLRDENLFDIVRHLNLGGPLLTDDQERLELAQINLQAAQRAKSSAAYQAAAAYLQMGISLLPSRPWELVHDLAFALHHALAESEYVCGRLEAAEALFATLVAHSKNQHERVTIHCLRTDLYAATGRLNEAISEALIGLSVCGAAIPATQQDRQALLQSEQAAVTRNLGGRTIAELVDAPAQTDSAGDDEQRVLRAMYVPSYLCEPTLLVLCTFRRVNGSLVNGNSVGTASNYMAYAVFLAGALGRYEEAVEFGLVALKLHERFPAAELTCNLHFQFGCAVAHYRLPLRESIAHLEQALLSGPECGDLLFSPFAAWSIAAQALGLGQPLTTIAQHIQRAVEEARRLQATVVLCGMACFNQMLRALCGDTRGLTSLDDGQFDEKQHLAMLQDQKMGVSEYLYYRCKAQLAYLAGDFQAAYELAAAAERLLPSSVGNYMTTEVPFWRALAVLAQRPGRADGLDGELTRDLNSLAAFADNAPMNYLHKLRLVEAELARVAGDENRALDLYHEALQLAEAGGFTSEAALTHEVWSAFLRSRRDLTGAHTHRQAAIHLYSQWGATAKVALWDELTVTAILGN